MGWRVIKVDNGGEERFLVWSSIVDAPVTFGCTADEVMQFFLDRAARDARESAERALSEARDPQLSRQWEARLEDVVVVNRAGPGEAALTADEIVEFYVRRQTMPTKEALSAYRKSVKTAASGGGA